MSNRDKTRNRRKRRTASIRVRDKEGNVVIRQIKRKRRSRGIPGLTWKRVPSLILGLLLILYAYMAYLYKIGSIKEKSSQVENLILEYYEQMDSLIIFFLGGSFAIAVAGFIGYAFIARGFKIKKWGEAFRHLLAIIAAVIILTAIVSPFINEPGKVRQQSDDEFVTVTDQFDLSGLDSPFYQELLNGLLDLIGNIPNPDQVAATIYPAGDETFDPNVDQYLWRWTVAETYDTEKMDFMQAFENVELDYTTSTMDPLATPDEMKQFRINEQYLTLTTAYTGEALTTWNSEAGSLIGDTADFSFITSPENATVYTNGIRIIKDANEQPVISINLDQSGTSGYIGYDSYWMAEQKDMIASNSISRGELNTVLNNVPVDRFGQFDTADLISQVWGEQSLPGGSGKNYRDADPYGGFQIVWDQIDGSTDLDTSVYTTMLLINNAVTSSIITSFLAKSLDIYPETARSAAPDGVDKAYFFFEAIDKGTPFGMQDLIAGFVNMARAFNIPARPIIGFSIGDVQSDQIEVRLEHLHLWIEALIPWEDTSTHYSWGMFNPFPDPYLVDQGFFYGRNSLGGQPEIEMIVTTGADQDLGQPVGGETSFKLHQFEELFNASIRIKYDDFPTPDQNIEFKLMTEADLLAITKPTDIFTLGINLGTVTTDSDTAWGSILLNATRIGNLYRNYDNGTVTNITATEGLIIQALNPLGSLGTYRIYTIVALYGLSYQTVMVGWSIDANITLALEMETKNIPGESYDAGAVIPQEAFNLTAFYYDSDDNGISNEDSIDLLIMDQATFTSKQSQFATGSLSASDLQQYNEGIFPATDAGGFSTISYNFPLSTPTDAIYVAVAYLRDTSVIGYTFVYVTDEVSFDSSLNTHNDGIKVNITSGFTWHIETNAIELNGTFGILFGFTPRNASGVNLSYYAIEKDYYEANFYLQTYATLDSYLGGSSCRSTSGDSDCYYFDPSNPDANFNVTGGDITNTFGLANATIKMNNLAFTGGYYVFVVVNDDFGAFTNTSRFMVIESAIIESIDIDNVIKIDDQIDSYNIPMIRPQLPEIYKTVEAINYTPLLIAILSVQSFLVINNQKEVRS